MLKLISIAILGAGQFIFLGVMAAGDVSTVVNDAKSCFERESKDSASSFLSGTNLQTITDETLLGTDTAGYVIFLKTQLAGPASGCSATFELTEHGLSLSVNNLCGISPKFANFYLADDERLACIPPSITLRMETKKEGIDEYGQPTSEVKVLKFARTQKGDCVDSKSVFFRNLSTGKATRLTFDVRSLRQCFRELTSGSETEERILAPR